MSPLDQPIRQWLRFIRSSTKFHVRPVQMTSEVEVDGGEKSTPKEDLVVGETRYVGRRISLGFPAGRHQYVLRLIAEVMALTWLSVKGSKVRSR